jgi:hypothetical protein
MRYLKNKIAKAIEHHKLSKTLVSPSKSATKETFQINQKSLRKNLKNNDPKSSFMGEENHVNSIKTEKRKRAAGNNVMKNYCAAMIHFAFSQMAEPYLAKLPEIQVLTLSKFYSILKLKKSNVNCISNLRQVLVQEQEDSDEIKAFKVLFQKACTVFLKFFSVNWIYNSKLTEKSKYLRYRGRLLRRVQDPAKFTYLEEFKEKKVHKRRSQKC